ncbi:hypothetical protein MHU86_538 [Fragilaria crotonensis]|nr:hypothetical protein MHU86_538 [Fragilaria crotonensis]
MMTPRRCIVALFLQMLSITAIAGDSGFSSSISICSNAAIQVHNLTYYCDSPYTFYYGNGAHRKSETCDYGDKVTVAMKFYVAEAVESTIYMQLAAYDNADEQLLLAGSMDLCNDFVGKSCNSVGYYSFSTKVQFAYIDGEETQFVPNWEVSFSDAIDGGFDLGGVNVQCDTDQNAYFDWQSTRGNRTIFHERTETFVQDYGILIVTCVSLAVLGIVLLNQTKDSVDYSRLGSNRSQLLDSAERLS